MSAKRTPQQPVATAAKRVAKHVEVEDRAANRTIATKMAADRAAKLAAARAEIAAADTAKVSKAAAKKAADVAKAKQLVAAVESGPAPILVPLAKLVKAAKAGAKAKKPALTVVPDAATKTCSRCKVAKPLNPETFARDNSSKDGFYGQCKQCEADYRAAKKLVAAAPAAPVAAPAPAAEAGKSKKSAAR